MQDKLQWKVWLLERKAGLFCLHLCLNYNGHCDNVISIAKDDLEVEVQDAILQDISIIELFEDLPNIYIY